MTTDSHITIPEAFYRVSVKGVIRRGTALLLVREHTHWVLPGGGLDHGEELEKGLRRELKEELAIDGPTEIDFHPVYVDFAKGVRDEFPGVKIPCCFICFNVSIEGDVNPGPMAKEVDFFEATDLKDEMLGEDERRIIKRIAAS